MITEAPATKKAAETTRASASENSTPPSEGDAYDPTAAESADSQFNEMPVLSPDGEGMVEASENSSDSSFLDEKDSSDTQTTAQGEIGTSDKKSESNFLPIIVAAICGVVVLAGVAIFAVYRKRNKR